MLGCEDVTFDVVPDHPEDLGMAGLFKGYPEDLLVRLLVTHVG